MEEQKQELLKYIENLDWEKFNSLSGVHCIPNYKIVLKCLQECQKQPIIEQQLEEMGFTQSYNYRKSGLDFVVFPKYIHLGYQYGPDNELLYYNAQFNKKDTNKILDFAKYLKELKEKDQACAV